MIPFERIAALVCGDLEGAEADAVEEHLLACDPCARLADLLVAVGREVAALVAGGRTRGMVTAATARRLRALGLPMGEYRLGPGESVRCSIAAGDLLNLATFELPTGTAGRIDGLVLAAGREVERFADVPVDREANEVTLIESGERLRTLPTAPLTVRLLAVDGEGEHPLCEYTLDHVAGG